MPLDNKISNIIGTKLPEWVLNQLETRANKNTQDSRDNDNILFLTNKSAWVRLVSSVNVQQEGDINYFKRLVGDQVILDPTSLAKNFVLFGGTSKYLDKNSYQLRSGLGKNGAYSILGDSEIKDFGYRPMPGITSVNIDTQGRLGSVRMATINFRCWDKNQLDIIDALYFKLGFTMFLEWGHTYFYPSAENSQQRDPNKIISTELYSIDPFEQDLNKEDIQLKIAQNSRNTEGNYDAMLGIVTNFNFTYNQDGGYDCSLRLMGLGVLGDSIKINNAGTLPSILAEEILALNKTLIDIELDRLEREAAAAAAAAKANAAATAPPKIEKLKAEDYFNKYIKYIPAQNQSKERYEGGQVSLPSTSADSPKNVDAVFNTEANGPVYFIRKQKGFIPLSSTYLPSVKVTLDTDRLLSQLENAKLSSGAKGFTDSRLWKFPANYLENAKDIIAKPITTVVDVIINGITSLFTKTTVSTGESELDKINDTGEFVVNAPSNNGRTYTLTIKRKLWAISNRTDIIDSYGSISKGLTYSDSAYYYIDTETFANQLKNVLKSPVNTYVIKSVDAVPNKTTTTFYFAIPFTRKAKVAKEGSETKTADIKNPDGTVTKGQTKIIPDSIVEEDVEYKLYVEISIDDSSFIKSFTIPEGIIEPLEFKTTNDLQNQNKVEDAQAEAQNKPAKPDLKAIESQIKQSLNYQSTLEIMLRTIQVHALNKAINKTGKDLEIGRTTYVLDITNKDDQSGGKTFLNQIFSTGVFSTFIQQLVNDEIKISQYNTDIKIDPKERFKIQAKYGFASSLLANKEDITSIPSLNFKDLLKAYVVPYQINQELIKGTYTNHPVYIPLGLLLMILNHACTIYDTKEDSSFQTPLVYIDFNPETNFCLTNAKHLSTDPWTCLIPFQGSFEDYKQLFDRDILTNNGDAIDHVSGSTETVPLFNPDKQDRLSGDLPKLKFGTQSLEATGELYRGKMMNILLNLDYLVKLVQQYSYKDGTNSVYLKTFLEQILSDVNKSLGNFNMFRLSYNDQANTFQIIDDQFIPGLSNEEQVTPKPKGIKIENTTELPLLGKFSIAKNLEIKSEVSSKLSNMLAISANANYQNKATLSTNGDSFGFVNASYVDRYITNRGEITGSNSQKNRNDTLKISAGQFNTAISDFYSKINPSQTTVAHATNYYIEKMTIIKNEDYATRASAMIPVSVNFTTDGISGLAMGQAFTVPDKLLPYTYTIRKIPGAPIDHINNVGFVIVGLTHKMEGNRWDTSVRANMIFLKDKTEFSGSVVKVEARTGRFGVNESNQNSYNEFSSYVGPKDVSIPSGEPRKNLVAAITSTSSTVGIKMLALAQTLVEGYYPNTAAYRNNNPGNIRSTQGPFRQFATLQEGAQEMVSYIERAVNKVNRNYTNADTLAQYINVYAPSEDNNDPNSYISLILGYFKKVGVDRFTSNSLMKDIAAFNENITLS